MNNKLILSLATSKTSLYCVFKKNKIVLTKESFFVVIRFVPNRGEEKCIHPPHSLADDTPRLTIVIIHRTRRITKPVKSQTSTNPGT